MVVLGARHLLARVDLGALRAVAAEAVVALADIYVHFTIAAAIHFASAR